jgi:hypothetical protein
MSFHLEIEKKDVLVVGPDLVVVRRVGVDIRGKNLGPVDFIN